MEQYENDNELIYLYRIHDYAANYFIQKYEKQIDLIIQKELYNLPMTHCEEIKQLALMKLIEIIDKYRPDKKASFQRYFKCVINHLIVDYLRDMNREFHYLQEYGQTFPQPVINEGDWWYYSNQGRKLRHNNPIEHQIKVKDAYTQLLNRCTPIQRKIIILRMMGYNQKEIADRLHKKASNISYHMKIIRQMSENL